MDDDLRVGIAITRDEFDLVEKLTEAELADALRHQARELEFPQLLLAIADALDNPEAPLRLKLVRAKRGQPGNKGGAIGNLHIAEYVRSRLKDGVKQEAAVAEIRGHLGISRATAMKALAEGRKLLSFVDELSEMAKQLKLKADHRISPPNS
jgi:hypothetical protein